jgi:NADP-dependent 3-hydroxy acid dehydrogenase YdfG
LPARDQWPDVVPALSADDPTSRRIRAVDKLERLGAEVLTLEADVTDPARMRDVVSLARARFGRIDGVIHAAGIAGGGMIQLKKSEAAAAVLAPKVQGARVLARLFHDQPIDFMVLCSSLTSLVGGIGQVDYCGANAYLDAFARQYARETGTFTVAVNWNTWREVGMAVDTAVPEDLRDALRRSRLTSGMTNRDGVDAFRRILARCTEPQIAISPANLGLQLEAAMLDDEPATSSAVGGRFAGTEAAAVASHPRPTLPSPYVAPGTETEQRICAIWQESLGIERVGIDDNFFDLGGHSLLAIQVMGRANRALRADVPVARLYDGLTVRFIAGLIDRLDLRPAIEADADLLERRRDKARRQREHQQRRRVAMGR